MPPRFNSKWISDLCELGPKPFLITGLLRSWLTGHFSSTGNLENTKPEEPVIRMLWKSDKTTGIVIESISKWKPELTENRPGIIIKRNKFNKISPGINDKMMGTKPLDGNDRYENFWQGSHTILCIANDKTETELLAAEVFGELNEFSPIIRSLLDLNRFSVSDVGDLVELQEGRENFVVPINVVYVCRQTWKITTSMPTIKKIDVSAMLP